ncbi:MAG TPA: hypothetical protein VFS33_08160 [Gemmatimonadales bacterium]|nr:hypothetical protein [Gemmatimonadales bacterium]
MTRPQLAALCSTLTTARTDIERQAALVGAATDPAILAPVEAIDRALALFESDLVAMDEALEAHVAALPRTPLAGSERAVYLPEAADAAEAVA